ncbi:MAG: phosphoribosyltransferase family protein [bacterium]|nr:phosphoribosyltransferase family protein [bacterium]
MDIERIKTVLRSLLDIVLPRKARTIRAENWTLYDLAVSPKIHDALGISITTLLDYKNPAVEDCIRALKYDGSSHACSLLAETLSDYLREEIAQAKSFSPRLILLVPIPLHKTRERERGFNQVESVLKKLPKEFLDGPLATFTPNALARTRETKQQTHLSRALRLQNMSGAFAVPDTEIVRGAHIFLIDDVTTTGATLSEATRVLERVGAEVSPLALARA